MGRLCKHTALPLLGFIKISLLSRFACSFQIYLIDSMLFMACWRKDAKEASFPSEVRSLSLSTSFLSFHSSSFCCWC